MCAASPKHRAMVFSPMRSSGGEDVGRALGEMRTNGPAYGQLNCGMEKKVDAQVRAADLREAVDTGDRIVKRAYRRHLQAGAGPQLASYFAR